MTARALLALGALLHGALLLGPFLLTGSLSRLLAPATLALVLLSTLAMLAEAQVARPRPATDYTGADRRAHRLAAVTGLVLLVILWTGLAGPGRIDVPAPVAGLGGAAMVLGAGLRRRAVVQLAGFFRTQITVADGQPLCTLGIFGALRHPSELGLLLFASGSALLVGSPWSLCLTTLVLLPLTLVRIHAEERELRAAFGSEYDAYAERTPGLIPRLGRRPLQAAEPQLPGRGVGSGLRCLM